MLLYILGGIVAIIAIILIAASRKPGTVHYERSIVINTTTDRIQPHITDFRKWGPWSPWEKKDPAMTRDFSGASSGIGARYGWKGNNKVGEGGMEIRHVSPEKVTIDMRFIKPWKAECLAEFHFTPQAGGTQVRWTMDGPQIFLGKVMSLFMNMDRMIGRDFEAGLVSLKAVAEKG